MGVTPQTISNYVQEGLLGGYKDVRTLYVNADDVEKFAEKYKLISVSERVLDEKLKELKRAKAQVDEELSEVRKGILGKSIKGELRNMTVSVTPSGKYYVCIMAQVEVEDLEKTNQSVGIDLGLKDFVITSDGERYTSNKFIKKYSKKLASMQKHLSRKKKGSGSWNKQRIKVARLQEKIMFCRNDKLHKISTDLIRKYDVICCEDLNVKGMVKNHHLAKSISDASWGTFVTMLEYKAKWYGKTLSKIDRFYPSSKTCHYCGYVKEDLSLSDRFYTCPNCGKQIDRDLNAAMNILDEGLRNISAGTVDYTDGGGVRLACKHSPMKSESHKSLACG